MLNKKQILERLQYMLRYRGVANEQWFCDEIESLISSADSPEKF